MATQESVNEPNLATNIQSQNEDVCDPPIPKVPPSFEFMVNVLIRRDA